MKKALMLMSVLATAAGTFTVSSEPANAYVVRKVVTVGPRCRTVRIIKRTPFGRRVIIRRNCL